MQEPERKSSEMTAREVKTFSFDVRAEASENVEALETFQIATLPSAKLEDSLLEVSPRIQESPDDLFAYRFGVVPRRNFSFDPQVADVVDASLVQVLSEGLFDLDSVAPQGFSIRRGGSGALSEDLAVRWLSYTEEQTQSWLLPDFNAVQAMVNAESPDLEVDVQGVERFTVAEARVLMIGEGDEIGLGVFVPAACRAEAIEHFVRAIAGSGEPSFLYNALEQEVVRVLDGETPVGSKDYQDVLTWIRANLSWSVVCFHSSASYSNTAESIVLDLMMHDPESQDFLEAFGAPALRCRVSFGNPQSAFVQRPSFEWFHRNS
jgi:hypothetical protein